MKPLDVGFMFPLKTYYSQAIEVWFHNNPGKVQKMMEFHFMIAVTIRTLGAMTQSVIFVDVYIQKTNMVSSGDSLWNASGGHMKIVEQMIYLFAHSALSKWIKNTKPAMILLLLYSSDKIKRICDNNLVYIN